MTNHDKTETGIIERRAIEALGLDIDSEIKSMMQNIETFPPRVRIEHSSSGLHRMFIDLGESYDAEAVNQIDLPGNEISGIVCYAQAIKALWAEGESVPRCASVENQPTVAESINGNCLSCPEGRIGIGRCKAKIRLLLLTWLEDKPTLLVFNLSPTSIKHWRNHVSKLARSKSPYIAVHTRFSLSDTKKNTFRWAEVLLDVDRVVTQEELNAALAIREQFKAQMVDISEADYSDPGDKQEKPF